jgi:hypothetical protein
MRLLPSMQLTEGVSASTETSHSARRFRMVGKSQTRSSRPIGNLVRFQAIGRQAAMTDMRAQSCPAFLTALGSFAEFRLSAKISH